MNKTLRFPLCTWVVRQRLPSWFLTGVLAVLLGLSASASGYAAEEPRLMGQGLTSGVTEVSGLFASSFFGRHLSGRLETLAEGFNHPYKIIFENGDMVMTVDGALLRITPSGKISTIAGLPHGPPGSVSAYGPDYIVVDNPNGRLLRVTRDGQVYVVATGLGLPNVAVQEEEDFIVVDIATPVDTELGPARLLRVSLDGTVVPIAMEGLGGPAGLYIDEDGYWVTDFILGRLLLVTREGEVRVIAESLGQPLDIAFDGESFLVTDFAHGFTEAGVNRGRILRISKTGRVRVIGPAGVVGNPTGLVLRGPDVIFTDVVTGEIRRIRGPRIIGKRP
jgi:hypothetical protein